MSHPVPGPQAAGPAGWKTWTAVTLCAALWGTAFIGVRPLGDPDEGRYAQAAREMEERGEWLVPTLDGRPHLTKPPGTYWATAAGLAVGGRNEWGARLPVGLAFAIWILTAFAVGRRWGGSRAAGSWSAIVLATSLLPFVGGSLLTADPFLAAMVGAAVAAAACGIEDPVRRPAALLAAGAALGAAFFVKGPPGWLPLVGVAAAWPWRRDPRPGDRRWAWWALLLAVGLGGWWFVVMGTTDPSRWRSFLGGEVVDRLFSPGMRRNEPLWLPAGIFLLGTLPWGLGLLWPPPRIGEAWRRPLGRMLLAWVGFSLLVFTLSRSKMPLYVLPLALAPAVAAGRRWAGWAASRTVWQRAAALFLLLACASLGLGLRLRGEQWIGYRHSKSLASLLEARRAPGEEVFLLQSRFEPGLAFYLDRPPVRVAVSPGDRLLPHDLTLEQLAGVAARQACLVAGRPAALERKPVSWKQENLVDDPASRFRVARWSALPGDSSGAD